MKEKWKKIKKFPNYSVSNFGRVKRIKKGKSTYIGKILKPFKDRYGYLLVYLSKDGFRKDMKIHKLVAETFIGPCPKGKEVNHINPDKSDLDFNCAWNLEYVTHKENMQHAAKNNLMSNGEKNGISKLFEDEVLEIRKFYKTGNFTQKELGRKFKVSQPTIFQIVRKKTWAHI